MTLTLGFKGGPWNGKVVTCQYPPSEYWVIARDDDEGDVYKLRENSAGDLYYDFYGDISIKEQPDAPILTEPESGK